MILATEQAFVVHYTGHEFASLGDSGHLGGGSVLCATQELCRRIGKENADQGERICFTCRGGNMENESRISNNREIGKNLQIEGLRGLSTLPIVLYHLFCRYQEIYLGRYQNHLWLESLAIFGMIAFVIMSSYFLWGEDRESGFSLGRFYQKKILRLWPSYFLCITITFTVLQIFNLPERMSTFGEYVANVFFVNGFLGINYVDGAHWYLTTMVLLISIAGVLKRFRLDSKWYVFLLWMILNMLCRVLGIDVLWRFTGGDFVGLVCAGTILHRFMQCCGGGAEEKKKFVAQWGVVALAACGHILQVYGFWNVLRAIAAVVLIWGCLRRKVGILNNRIFVFMGKISYPVYLIHQNIAFQIEYCLMRWHGEFSYWFAVIALFVVTALGVAIYYCFERPVQRWIKKF